jgi:hypothetical protein
MYEQQDCTFHGRADATRPQACPPAAKCHASNVILVQRRIDTDLGAEYGLLSELKLLRSR